MPSVHTNEKKNVFNYHQVRSKFRDHLEQNTFEIKEWDKYVCLPVLFDIPHSTAKTSERLRGFRGD